MKIWKKAVACCSLFSLSGGTTFFAGYNASGCVDKIDGEWHGCVSDYLVASIVVGSFVGILALFLLNRIEMRNEGILPVDESDSLISGSGIPLR